MMILPDEEMNIGKNLKEQRTLQGLTQRELSKRSGITNQQISDIENGRVENIELRTAIAISVALEISIDELVFGEKTDSEITQEIEKLPKDSKKTIKEILTAYTKYKNQK